MQKTAQAWFMGGPSSSEPEKPTSLLAEWNSYASARSSEDAGSSGFGFDLEAAMRTANDKVSGTLNVVSKGVRDLPGNIQSAANTVPSGKSLMYFGLFLASGVFFIFIAFTMFLPVMVLMPQKFAICFTLGCLFIIGSFFALKGPKNQLAHMSSKERLPFTVGFIGSMVGTIYVSMVLHSYILSVLFSVLQLCFGSAVAMLSLSASSCTVYEKGISTIILFSLLLPRRFCGTEVPYFNCYIFYPKMLWPVTIDRFFFVGVSSSLSVGTAILASILVLLVSSVVSS